ASAAASSPVTGTGGTLISASAPWRQERSVKVVRFLLSLVQRRCTRLDECKNWATRPFPQVWLPGFEAGPSETPRTSQPEFFAQIEATHIGIVHDLVGAALGQDFTGIDDIGAVGE